MDENVLCPVPDKRRAHGIPNNSNTYFEYWCISLVKPPAQLEADLSALRVNIQYYSLLRVL